MAGDRAVPEGSVTKRHRCEALARGRPSHKDPSVPVPGGCRAPANGDGRKHSPDPIAPAEPRFPTEFIWGAAKQHPQNRRVSLWGGIWGDPGRNPRPSLEELVAPLFIDKPPCSAGMSQRSEAPQNPAKLPKILQSHRLPAGLREMGTINRICKQSALASPLIFFFLPFNLFYAKFGSSVGCFNNFLE